MDFRFLILYNLLNYFYKILDHVGGICPFSYWIIIILQLLLLLNYRMKIYNTWELNVIKIYILLLYEIIEIIFDIINKNI
jgi:hypothetical protein